MLPGAPTGPTCSGDDVVRAAVVCSSGLVVEGPVVVRGPDVRDAPPLMVELPARQHRSGWAHFWAYRTRVSGTPPAFWVMASTTVAPALWEMSRRRDVVDLAHALSTVSICASAKTDSRSNTTKEWMFIVDVKEYDEACSAYSADNPLGRKIYFTNS